MELKKKMKKDKIYNAIYYIFGSVALFAAACFAIPKIMPYISGFLYKYSVRSSNAKKDEDDWGPVIERKKPR